MKRLTILGAILITASWPVSAAETNNGKLFEALDINNDGFITQQELASVKRLVADWGDIDANKSGGVDTEEFAALKPAEAFVPVEEDDEPIGAAPLK